MQGAVGAAGGECSLNKQTNRKNTEAGTSGNINTQISLSEIRVSFFTFIFGPKGSHSLEVVCFFFHSSSNQKTRAKEFSQELNHIPSACVLSIKLDVECVACSIFPVTYIHTSCAATTTSFVLRTEIKCKCGPEEKFSLSLQ